MNQRVSHAVRSHVKPRVSDATAKVIHQGLVAAVQETASSHLAIETMARSSMVGRRVLIRASCLLLALMAGLIACTKHAPVLPPEIKMNPAPKVRYEITITMEEAPVSLRGFTGRVQYSMSNYLKCIPRDHTIAIGGSIPDFNKKAAIEFRRAEGNSFKAELVYDLLLDDDYYGLGVCNWSVAGLDAQLPYPGLGREAGLSGSVLALPLKQSAHEFFCIRFEHARGDLDKYCTTRQGMRTGKVIPESHYFKVTFRIKEKI